MHEESVSTGHGAVARVGRGTQQSRPPADPAPPGERHPKAMARPVFRSRPGLTYFSSQILLYSWNPTTVVDHPCTAGLIANTCGW